MTKKILIRSIFIFVFLLLSAASHPSPSFSATGCLTPGTTKCNENVAGWVQTCSNCDIDPENEWCNTVNCSASGKECVNGACQTNPDCIDNDHDGYGNPGHASCPNGEGLDCDDTKVAAYPGASETCYYGSQTDNDCDEQIGCSDSDCSGNPACNAPCVLTSARWQEPLNIQAGNTATLIVNGQNCDGQTIKFEIWEDNPSPLSDRFISTPNQLITFSGNTAQAVWPATWECEVLTVFGYCANDPEYYFKAALTSNNFQNGISSPINDASFLNVSQGTGEITGTELTAGTVSGNRGAEIIVPITLSAEAGANISMVSFDITYDSTKLSFSSDSNTTINNVFTIIEGSQTTGTVSVSLVELNDPLYGVIANGQIVDVRFNILNTAAFGNTNITFSNDASVINKDSQTITIDGLNSGTVTVSDPSQLCVLTSAYWQDPKNIQAGQTATLVVNGTNCAGKEVKFKIYEDELGTDNPLFVELPNTVIFSGNTATINWTAEWFDDGLLQGDPEYYFKAELVSNSNINITSSTNSSSELHVSQGGGSGGTQLTAGTVSGTRGSEIIVPITLSAAAGTNISVVSFDLTYDSTKLSFSSDSNTTTNNVFTIIEGSQTPGTVSVSLIELNDPLYGAIANGQITGIKFTGITLGNTNITFSNATILNKDSGQIIIDQLNGGVVTVQ